MSDGTVMVADFKRVGRRQRLALGWNQSPRKRTVTKESRNVVIGVLECRAARTVSPNEKMATSREAVAISECQKNRLLEVFEPAWTAYARGSAGCGKWDLSRAATA